MHDICMLLDSRIMLLLGCKMRVGAHLEHMYEILMKNLPWNFDILCMKEVTSHKSQVSESISSGAKF